MAYHKLYCIPTCWYSITILGFSLAEIAGMFDQPTDAADVHSALKFRSDIYTIGSIYTRDAVN